MGDRRNHGAGIIPLVNTTEEKNVAALERGFERGVDTEPTVPTDALATASIIYSALGQLNDNDMPTNLMRSCASRLSQNSLTSWTKGAVLITGNYYAIRDTFGHAFCHKNCYPRPDAGNVPPQAERYTSSVADNNMKPWLANFRRQHGSGWEGCFAAAKFIEDMQLSKLRDEQWQEIPSVTRLEMRNGTVKGYEGINNGIGGYGRGVAAGDNAADDQHDALLAGVNAVPGGW